MNTLLLSVLLGFSSVQRLLTQSAAVTPSAALTRSATAPTFSAEWFVAAFASALPQVQGGFRGFGSQYGAFQGVDDLGGDVYRLRYAGGSVTVSAQLNAAGQFTTLFLKGQEAAAPAGPAATPVSVSTPQAALARLFSAGAPSAEWFSAEFLQQVPLGQLTTIVAGPQQPGHVSERRRAAGRQPDSQFSPGHPAGQARQRGRAGPLHRPAARRGRPTQSPSWPTRWPPSERWRGRTSVVVIENGKVIGSLDPHSKLAVGSAFKLGILAELLAQTKTGSAPVVGGHDLAGFDKALPSGFLQTWPEASPLTLQTLATLMISQSDNTATNVLLRLVGRGRRGPAPGPDSGAEHP